MKFLVLLLALSNAHAGIFSRFCAKHLVADDPYQYEQTNREWLEKELQRLQIKAAWKTASSFELNQIQLIQGELANRDEGKSRDAE